MEIHTFNKFCLQYTAQVLKSMATHGLDYKTSNTLS